MRHFRACDSFVYTDIVMAYTTVEREAGVAFVHSPAQVGHLAPEGWSKP